MTKKEMNKHERSASLDLYIEDIISDVETTIREYQKYGTKKESSMLREEFLETLITYVYGMAKAETKENIRNNV